MTLLKNDIEEMLIVKKNHLNFKSGDTITVYYKIKEGDKERTQFEIHRIKTDVLIAELLAKKS